MNTYDELADKFKTIGHPVRIAILNLMCNCGFERLQVKEIYHTLELEQPNVSRHLNIMRKTGIVRRIQDGGQTYYGLCTEDEHVKCIAKCFS